MTERRIGLAGFGDEPPTPHFNRIANSTSQQSHVCATAAMLGNSGSDSQPPDLTGNEQRPCRDRVFAYIGKVMMPTRMPDCGGHPLCPDRRPTVRGGRCTGEGLGIIGIDLANVAGGRKRWRVPVVPQDYCPAASALDAMVAEPGAEPLGLHQWTELQRVVSHAV